MTTRILTLVGGFALCTLLTCGDPVSGQPPPNPGTVSWATGYPKGVNSTPPPPMFVPAYIKYSGTYTANPGWTPAKAVGYWMEVKGGGGSVPTPFTMDLQNGAIGRFDATGKLVPVQVTFTAGTYQAWMAVTYQDGNKNFVASLSSVQTVTLK